MRACLGGCDKSNSGGEAMTRFSKDWGESVRGGAIWFVKETEFRGIINKTNIFYLI